MADGSAPFYERHRWKAVVAVVALVAAIWGLSGAPSPWKIVSDLMAADLPASNTMIVLDASEAMGGKFGKEGTKLDAALEALERFTLPITNEGLALRTFGGSCADSGRVVVDFAADNADEVQDAGAEQQPAGRSNLVNAVRAAIDDFADSDRFPEEGPRRIVVFAGSVDECAGSGGGDDIHDDMEHLGVDTTFKFVGLDLKSKGRRRLIAFKKAIGRPADVAFVDRNSDLDAVEDWLGQEAEETSECDDGVDNDGDAHVDDEDPDCATGNTEAPQQPAGECADGVDNDGDGTADSDDPECATGNTEAPQQPAGECADGVDNDGDGTVDSDDPECATGDTEAPEEPTAECEDGIDNDGDSLIDGNDPGCLEGDTEAAA